MKHINFIGTTEAENNGMEFTTKMQTNGFDFVADKPEVLGGNNLGPAPGDYLCMALASCKAMTLRIYIQRKQWSVDTVKVKVNLQKDDQLSPGNNTFYSEISITGNVDKEQLRRLLHIAKSCPVSKLLQKQNEVITTVVRTDDINVFP
jgi:putative redox protein